MSCRACTPVSYCPTCTALAARAGVHLAVTPPRQAFTLPPDAPEGVMQGKLHNLAEKCGLLYCHTYNSKRSAPGWPDTVIVRPDEITNTNILYLWELKATEGTVSSAQRRWLEALAKVSRIEAAVYRPQDWPIIVEKLLRK